MAVRHTVRMTPLRLLTAALTAATLVCVGTGSAAASTHDALDVRLQTQDAERFAALFLANKTQAEDLQSGYLDGAGDGVRVFTPHRIQTAAHLARQIRAESADYAHAIAVCLPLLPALNAELRAVYLAYQGLLPDLPLPAVHVVFGAGNSGGTAQPGIQVIGLEVMCRAGTRPEDFRAAMRMIFAHETAHTWQRQPTEEPKDLLLYAALAEGVPDLLAEIVTGRPPSASRDGWGRTRESEVWRRFQADRQSWQQGDKSAAQRWFGNAGGRVAGMPEDFPSEMGYWVGAQIAKAYLDRAPDKRIALRQLLQNVDPAGLLAASNYAPR